MQPTVEKNDELIAESNAAKTYKPEPSPAVILNDSLPSEKIFIDTGTPSETEKPASKHKVNVIEDPGEEAVETTPIVEMPSCQPEPTAQKLQVVPVKKVKAFHKPKKVEMDEPKYKDEPETLKVNETLSTIVRDETDSEISNAANTEDTQSILSSEEIFEVSKKTSTPIDLEIIVGQAEEQPLECALSMPAYSFRENGLEESKEAHELSKALRELHEVFLQSQEKSESIDGEPTITPEVVEKTLAFLTTLGYEEPDRVLTDFVEEHSPKMLIELIDYITRAYMEEAEKELTPKAFIVNMDENASKNKELFKAMLSLIMRSVLNPKPAN